MRGWPPADTSASTPHQSFLLLLRAQPQMAKPTACTTTEGEPHCVQQPQRAGLPDERNPTAPQMAKPNCTTNGNIQLYHKWQNPLRATTTAGWLTRRAKSNCTTNGNTHCVHDHRGRTPLRATITAGWLTLRGPAHPLNHPTTPPVAARPQRAGLPYEAPSTEPLHCVPCGRPPRPTLQPSAPALLHSKKFSPR